MNRNFNVLNTVYTVRCIMMVTIHVCTIFGACIIENHMRWHDRHWNSNENNCSALNSSCFIAEHHQTSKISNENTLYSHTRIVAESVNAAVNKIAALMNAIWIFHISFSTVWKTSDFFLLLFYFFFLLIFSSVITSVQTQY